MFDIKMNGQDTMFVLRSWVQIDTIIRELEPKNNMLTALASFHGHNSRRDIAKEELRFFDIIDPLIDMLRDFSGFDQRYVNVLENILRDDLWVRRDAFDPDRDLQKMWERHMLKIDRSYSQTHTFRFNDLLHVFKVGLCKEWDVTDPLGQLEPYRRWYMAKAKTERFANSTYRFPSLDTKKPGKDPFYFYKDGEKYNFATIHLPKRATDVSMAVQEFFSWDTRPGYDQSAIVPMSMVISLARFMGLLMKPLRYNEVQNELFRPENIEKMRQIQQKFRAGDDGIRKMIELKAACKNDIMRYAENVDHLLKNNSAGFPS